LLLLYPFFLVPVVLGLMIKDIIVKKEGLPAWHRDSMGILLERWFISLFLIISVLMLVSCENTDSSTGLCIGRSLIPLAFPLLCASCKVICLRD